MAHLITEVLKGSPAYKAGIRKGESLKSINGENIVDFIDYQYLSSGSILTLETDKKTYRVKKREYDNLGLDFENPMMSGIRSCANKCMFCFVDQLPKNARPSLSVKDDDWRLSLLTGSYVTLTNVGDNELGRIIARHASPLYISVHAMDPELRSELLGNKTAGKLPEQLKKLVDGGIEFHAQAVLCPGINDGLQLERTINELADFAPHCLSLALVPVGLTSHRDDLAKLRKYTCEEARAVIEIANRYREKFLKTMGTRFVFPSDEFYLEAGMEIPSDEEYEDYGQIDDGVGMLRLFETEFESEIETDPIKLQNGVKPLIACGLSAYDFFKRLTEKHCKDVQVKAIENTFFGSEVTVSGLISGNDLINQLKDADCTHILITDCALRDEDGIFIDDVPLEAAMQALNKRIIPVGRTGDCLVRALNDLK